MAFSKCGWKVASMPFVARLTCGSESKATRANAFGAGVAAAHALSTTAQLNKAATTALILRLIFTQPNHTSTMPDFTPKIARPIACLMRMTSQFGLNPATEPSWQLRVTFGIVMGWLAGRRREIGRAHV